MAMVMVKVKVIIVYDVTSTHAQFVHRCATSDGLSQKAAPARNVSQRCSTTMKGKLEARNTFKSKHTQLPGHAD